jgi:hypothetical protein
MHALRVILAMSTFAAVGCQVVGGFEDFSAAGGAGSGAGGSGAGGGGAPAADCPAPPPGAEERYEAARRNDGTCFLIMKRALEVGAFYGRPSDVPGPSPNIDGACADVFAATATCLAAPGKGAPCRDLPATCVTNAETASFCAKQGSGQRLCSLAELRQQCGIKSSDLREWAKRCFDDGGVSNCDVLGDLPTIPPKAPPFACDAQGSTRADDRRVDMGFRCCVGPEAPPAP